MAGTLTLTTLSDGTNSTSATNCIQGSAKAWCNWQGGNGNTAGSINASYNVSSITVNSAGDFTVNFTNALADNKYSVSANSTTDGGNQSASFQIYASASAPTASAVRLKYYNSTAGQVAPVYGYVSIFR